MKAVVLGTCERCPRRGPLRVMWLRGSFGARTIMVCDCCRGPMRLDPASARPSRRELRIATLELFSDVVFAAALNFRDRLDRAKLEQANDIVAQLLPVLPYHEPIEIRGHLLELTATCSLGNGRRQGRN